MRALWIGVTFAAALFAGAAHGADAPLTAEALARRSGCFDCHAVDKKGTGPSFRDIATRYRGAASARGALIETIKKGGKRNWTDVTGGAPQPPYSALLSEAEIQRLVDWVLSHSGEKGK